MSHLELGVTLVRVPTIRPRHVITETDDVAAALDDAAGRWPEDAANRRRLLLRLIDEGHRVVVRQRSMQAADRRAAVGRTAGVMDGVYGPGYLGDLRREERA